MNDRPRMLLALEHAPSSSGLVDKAAAWAERLGHVLDLTTIVAKRGGLDRFGGRSDPQRGQDAIPRETKYWLYEMAERIPKSVRGDVALRSGSVAPSLIEASKTVSILVVGAHHRPTAVRLFLGSVAEAVVRGAACPVMVLPHGSYSLPADRPVNVRVPIHPSHLNTAGLEWLAEHLPQADATAVFAVPWLRIYGPNPQKGTRVFEAATAQLQDVLTEAGHGDIPQLVVIREEVNSGDAIANEAADAGADLIVLPTRRRSGTLYAVLGSVAERTVRAATVPVVVI